MKALLKWCVYLLVCLAPLALRADITAARAAFEKGKALESSKQYAAAAAQYQAALASEPSYTKIWRQIGNCRYYLGDKAGALQAYDAYLATNDDAPVRAFADRLRAQVPGAAPAPARPAAAASTAMSTTAPEAQAQAAEPAAKAEPQLSPFKVGVDFGLHTVAMTAFNSDWKAVVTSGTAPSITSAFSVGMDLGWRVLKPLDIGVDIDYYLLPMKADLTSGSFYEDKIDADYNFLWLGPSMAYDVWATSSGLRINIGGGVGYLMMMGATRTDKVTFFGSESDSTTTHSGSGVGFKAKIGGSWDLNRQFDAFCDLGYRMATIPKVTYTTTSSSGSSSGTYQRFGPGTSGDMPMEYSGLDFKLGANFRF